jgi:hypothetical protein
LSLSPVARRPPGDELRPLLDSDVDVPFHLAARRLVNQGPHVGTVLPAVAQLEPRRGVLEPGEEPVVHLPMEKQAAGRGTTLPRGPEGAPEHTVEGEVQVGVVHHDHRVLPAHLEGEPLVHPATGLSNQRSGNCRSGE